MSFSNFGYYDVLVEGFNIVQILAMSEVDAMNIAETKGYVVLDVEKSIEV